MVSFPFGLLIGDKRKWMGTIIKLRFSVRIPSAPWHSVRNHRSVGRGFSRATENCARGAIYSSVCSVVGATTSVAPMGSLRRGISTVSPSGIARKASSANPAS